MFDFWFQAYSYCGQNLLSLDKCGEAIRALKQSERCYNRALELCKPYSKAHGTAKPVKPDGHPFFQKLSPIVKITLDKCERENGFMWVVWRLHQLLTNLITSIFVVGFRYHQKVPDAPPELETKATLSEEFQLPPLAPLWEAVKTESLAAVTFHDKPSVSFSYLLQQFCYLMNHSCIVRCHL